MCNVALKSPLEGSVNRRHYILFNIHTVILISLQFRTEFFCCSLTSGYSPNFVLSHHYSSSSSSNMAMWSISVLVLFALILPNIPETNCNIQYKSNGLCDFDGYGSELIKLVSDKSRFFRNQIFDSNFKAVHLGLQRMEDSSRDISILPEIWNILRPIWVKEENADELLRTLGSVQFEKYSLKSSKTVFRTNVRSLDTHIYVVAMPPECVIRAVSYSLLRNVTGGNGLVCYDVLVMERLQHICCYLTIENSVQCKKPPSFSLQWLDMLSEAEPYLVLIMVLLIPEILVAPFLPRDAGALDEDDTMVEPDQNVNPIPKYVNKEIFGKLVGNSSSKVYGHAVIILILATLLCIGTLYVLIYCELFNFEEEKRKYYILEAYPMQSKTKPYFQNDQTLRVWLYGIIDDAVQFDRVLEPFHIFCLVWFFFHMLPLPSLLYITGVRSYWYFFPFLEFIKKLAKKSFVWTEITEGFFNFFHFLREKMILHTSGFKFFVWGLVCTLSFTVLLPLYVCYICWSIVKKYSLIHFEVVQFFFVQTLMLVARIMERRRFTRFVRFMRFVLLGGNFLHLLSLIAFFNGMLYFFVSTSKVLVSILRYSLVGLSVNHSMILPYMTFYGTVAYFMFCRYSSYVNGYVELRKLAFKTCKKILKENGNEQDIKRVVSRDDKGVIRINDKLLEHIYSEMKPLKKTVREMLFEMVVCCGLFYLFYQFIIEDEGTETQTRIPPLMQVVLNVSMGVISKLYNACKTGPTDMNSLTNMSTKDKVESIVQHFPKKAQPGRKIRRFRV